MNKSGRTARIYVYVGLFVLLAAWAAGLARLAAAADAGLRLAQDGKSDYVIVLSATADTVEQTAAAELRDYLLQVTGARLEIRSESDVKADVPQIVLGQAARTRSCFPCWR